MQQPPPQMGPPPPMGPPQGGQTAISGLDKKTAGLLCYLAAWVTGIIFLFVGKNDPDIKYHAAQSIVFFGGLQVLYWIFALLGGMPGLGGVFRLLDVAIGIIMVVGWIYSLYTVYQNNGARFTYPIIGSFVTPFAEQLASKV